MWANKTFKLYLMFYSKLLLKKQISVFLTTTTGKSCPLSEN